MPQPVACLLHGPQDLTALSHAGTATSMPERSFAGLYLHCREDSRGERGVTSVSQRPTRRRKGVIQRPSSRPQGCPLPRVRFPFCASHSCPAGSAVKPRVP